MADYVLSCCSTADLTKEHFERRNIAYVCFHFRMDGKEYMDDLGQSIPFREFYQTLADNPDIDVSTSQVNITEYLAHFEKYLNEGKDILHLCLSSGISGTYGSAKSAALIARERYPERKILIVDSLAASSGYGLLMDMLADLRDEGKSIEEVRDWAEENKLNIQHLFFSSDLTFFVKGGRISKAAALFGGILNICPLMDVDHTGHLVPREKIRGKKTVIKRMFKRMMELVQDGPEYTGKCYMCQSACLEDAQAVAALIEEEIPALKGKIEINDIGTTIGSHTGPGTVALFFYGKKRDN